MDESLPQAGTKSRRRLVWILLVAGLVIFLIWAALKAWRSYAAAASLLARQAEVETLLADGVTHADADALEELVVGVRADVVVLRDELGILMPVMPLLSWLPRVGPLAAVAPQLMEMADAGTEAAAYGMRGLKPALAVLQQTAADNASSSPITLLLPIIHEARPDLARASLAMDRVVAARAQLGDTQALPWRVRTLLAQADAWLPLAQDSLKMALVLPDLMGYESPRRYLLLAQNEDELRATGGFISGAGLLAVDNGRITQIDFKDANTIDAWADVNNTYGALTKPYDAPPEALSELMLLDLFLFRDANYWPDFPTSAQQAMALYSYGQDVPPLDGAIAFDQQFLRLLLDGTGPVAIPGSDETINSNNVISGLQDSWSLENGVQDRKAFLGTFALAIHDKIENGFDTIDPVNLARQLGAALHNKHLQIYVEDPQAAAMLAEVAWDGHLAPPVDHDALLIVDTNMGYNKANLFVERDTAYQVHLEGSGGGQAELAVTHVHTGVDNGEPCRQGTEQEYRERKPYLALADKCYWNYLRVYVPEGSELSSGPQHLVPAATWFGGYDWQRPAEVIQEVPGFTTFANFMLLPRGEKVTSRYLYRLPSSITQEEGEVSRYQLRLYRQAGVPAHRVQVAISLPPGAELVDVSPIPTARDEQTVYFVTELTSDQLFTVRYLPQAG